MRVSIHVANKDRHSELALLLQALRNQTFQAWDIIILDDASGTPLNHCHFLSVMINRLKMEGHKVKILRNEFSNGVCAARQRLIDEDTFFNHLILRLDDDCLPEPDYLLRLINVIGAGFDVATGVIPLLGHPEWKREVKFVEPIICQHSFDSEGNLVEFKDELGYCYLESRILPCHQFRTNALFKREVLEKVRYPQTLSNVGFREELWISAQCWLNGFKIGCDTGAVAYHIQAPSGGCRDTEYGFKVQLDDETTRKWLKEQFNAKGDFFVKN